VWGGVIKNNDFLDRWVRENGMPQEGNTEGFADDLTILFLMSREAIVEIKRVLESFYLVSGLSLNIRKTMERLGNFWNLQKLTITGRIMVAKTFLLSQVIFLMDTIPLNYEHGEKINKIMAYFVKGNDRIIAKNRWFLDISLGGYGLIDAHSLNSCVKASWINRWIHNQECRDLNGKRGVLDFTKPVDQWGPLEDRRLSDPFTFNILNEWKSFKRMFYKAEGNIGQALIFENDGILENNKNIGISVFGRERFQNLPQESKLKKVFEFFVGGNQKSKAEIELVMGTRLNMAEYFRLRNLLSEIQRVFGSIVDTGKGLDDYIRQKKRKGGQLRRVITGKSSYQYIANDPRRVPSAVTLWGEFNLMEVSRELIELNYSLWGNSRLSTSFRGFLFNLVQGRLYLNNVLANIHNVSNKCTFCEIIGIRDLHRRGIVEGDVEYDYYLNLQPVETISHLFWECPNVHNIIQTFYRWIRNLDWYRGVEEIDKKSFFVGLENDYKGLVEADLIWKQYIKYYIYQCRIRKKLPTFASLRYEFEGMIGFTSLVNTRANLMRLNILYAV